MKFPSSLRCAQALALTCLPILAGIAECTAQVPIKFDDFHGFTGTESYVRAVAKAHPDITELIEIGKSTMGRPIHVLVISNMSKGETIDRHVILRNMRKEGVENVPPMKAHQGKPGHWICGATHGNEFTGTEVCLYIIDKLITGYGSDPVITALVDDKAFYICPMVNPDGVYNSVERDITQRQNSMKKDDDGDGKINEDGPDDLNGDGHITQFRYPDPKGRYVIDDVDPRHMVRLGRKAKTDKQRYSVVREDKDNDGDGKIGEDDERGIDLNRNFPEGWFKEDETAGGKGEYPTSAPEIHAVVEFFTNYRNILMAQFFHTSGGFTFRPLGTASSRNMPAKDVAIFDRIMGKTYLEIIGEEVPDAWKTEGSLDKFKAELKRTSKNQTAIARGYEMPRGWRYAYNDLKDRRYSYGMATDWAYAQYGSYSLTTELWNRRKDMLGLPKFGGEDAALQQARAILKYQDEKFGGRFFVDWTAFDHPKLGKGEIGGWIPKYGRSNAFPGESLLGVCEAHWQFELFRAQLLPAVVISDAKAKVIYTSDDAAAATANQEDGQVWITKGESKGPYKIVEVTATIENQGKLATHLARGSRLAGNRQDVVWLIGDRDKISFMQGTPFQSIGVLEGTMPIPGYKAPARPTQTPDAEPARQIPPRGRMRPPMPYPGRPRGRRGRSGRSTPVRFEQKREVKWLIAIRGRSTLKVVATSQKGGTQVKELGTF